MQAHKNVGNLSNDNLIWKSLEKIFNRKKFFFKSDKIFQSVSNKIKWKNPILYNFLLPDFIKLEF